MQYLLLTIDTVNKEHYRITSNFRNEVVTVAEVTSLEKALKEAEAIIARERIRHENSDNYYRGFDRNF